AFSSSGPALARSERTSDRAAGAVEELAPPRPSPSRWCYPLVRSSRLLGQILCAVIGLLAERLRLGAQLVGLGLALVHPRLRRVAGSEEVLLVEVLRSSLAHRRLELHDLDVRLGQVDVRLRFRDHLVEEEPEREHPCARINLRTGPTQNRTCSGGAWGRR